MHQDNAPDVFELDSPDLVSSDFHLFLKLKNYLGGQRFSSTEEVVTAVTEYFTDQGEKFYQTGIITGITTSMDQM